MKPHSPWDRGRLGRANAHSASYAPLLVLLASGALFLLPGCSKPVADKSVAIGAKKMTESVILAEMGTQLARHAGVAAQRVDLGGTPALWLALTQGDIDAYVEYTGTITRQILQEEPADLARALAVHGVKISAPLGFRNNYALGMRKDVAAAKGITKISDLRAHPELRFGFTHEFLDRPDGWPGLKQQYELPQTDVRGMNHTLAYTGLVERAIDLMELYTTDGEIAQYNLFVLEDDRGFFPSYEAVWLYRDDLAERHPQVVAGLMRLEGKISEADMQQLNTTVQQEKSSAGQVAQTFLRERFGNETESSDRPLAARLWQRTVEHLALVVPSLLAAVIVAVPLGVLAFRRPRVGHVVLAVASILQTIPSLALLLFMIPVMGWLVGKGIGAPPAIAALFLYSLLPIVRNTHAGLSGISTSLRESAAALGLSRWATLWRVELPLAAPMILAGIRTATVINVGTATLGGFIGAGGYGAPILRGLDKGDVPLMLEGAIPAAVMALVLDGLFAIVQRVTRHG